MTDTDRIEALTHLSQVHRGQFDERRKYEWKAFVTLLTFYVLCVASKYAGKSRIPDNLLFNIIVWIAFIGIAVLTSLFLARVNIANKINKGIAKSAEDLEREMLKGTSVSLDVEVLLKIHGKTF